MGIKTILQNIDQKEWRLLIITAIALIIITSTPYLWGYLTKPADTYFLAVPTMNRGDYPNYFSYIEQVKSGHFLFKDLYTSEAQPRIILNLFFLGLGIMAKIFSLTSLQIFHLSRILLIPIFLLILYLFLCLFFEEKIKRKICLILVCFSSGLGVWFLPWTSRSFPPWNQPMDLWTPEAVTFPTLYTNPLFIFSLSLIILIFLLMLLGLENKNLLYAVWAGLAGLVLFQIHPYHFPTVFLVLGFFWINLLLSSLFKNKRINWLFLKYCLIFALISLPSLFYYLWLSNVHWLTSHRIIQAAPYGFTPRIINFFISYGLLWPLVLLGIYSFFKKKKVANHKLFLITWLVGQIFLIYSPLPLQRKMSEGLHIVICIIATSGVFGLVQFANHREFGQKLAWLKNKFFWAVIFIFFFAFSNVYIIGKDISAFPYPHLSVPQEIIKGMEWLKKNSPKESIILSRELNTGNLIPAFSLRMSYAGHAMETAYFERKIQRAKWFFETNNNDIAKQNFLRKNKIDYLFFYGEKNNILFQPREKEYLEKVFKEGGASIYRVKNL